MLPRSTSQRLAWPKTSARDSYLSHPSPTPSCRASLKPPRVNDDRLTTNNRGAYLGSSRWHCPRASSPWGHQFPAAAPTSSAGTVRKRSSLGSRRRVGTWVPPGSSPSWALCISSTDLGWKSPYVGGACCDVRPRVYLSMYPSPLVSQAWNNRFTLSSSYTELALSLAQSVSAITSTIDARNYLNCRRVAGHLIKFRWNSIVWLTSF